MKHTLLCILAIIIYFESHFLHTTYYEVDLYPLLQRAYSTLLCAWCVGSLSCSLKASVEMAWYKRQLSLQSNHCNRSHQATYIWNETLDLWLHHDKLLDLELLLTAKMKPLLILLAVIAAAVAWPDPDRAANDQATYTADDIFDDDKTYVFMPKATNYLLCHREGSIVSVGTSLADQTCRFSVLVQTNGNVIIKTNEGEYLRKLYDANTGQTNIVTDANQADEFAVEVTSAGPWINPPSYWMYLLNNGIYCGIVDRDGTANFEAYYTTGVNNAKLLVIG